MKKTITAKKAIKRGQLIVNLPVFILMVIIGLVMWFLSKVEILDSSWLPLGFLIAPAVAWIYWSFMITKWRIWAYQRVDDINELKKQAIDAGLIWKEGSFFEKTEIKTSTQRKLLQQLENENQIKKKDFIDDLSIPHSTTLEVTKLNKYAPFFYHTLVLAIGIYLILTSDSIYFGLAVLIIALFLLITTFVGLRKNTSLTLNQEGILYETRLYKWEEVNNENASMQGYGKSRKAKLYFEFDNDTIEIDVDDYEIDLSLIRKLLTVYRGRFELKNKSKNDSNNQD